MRSFIQNSRSTEAEVDCMFVDRWSPRAFLPDALPQHQIDALFEAARWAPSCYNEQPWLFIYATSAGARRLFASALVERNRSWAQRAPLLLFVLARRAFQTNGKANRHAAFDAGAAWMSLALQARRLGLYAHAMAGFDVKRAHEILGASEDEYDVLAAVAVGRRGDATQLPSDLQAIEKPNDRKPPAEIARAFEPNA